MTGHLGYESTGLNALRGQNNVQGLNDSGANPAYLHGYQPVDEPEMRKKFSEAWGVEVPETPGYRLDQIMAACHDNRIQALYLIGENPMQTEPNAHHVEEGIAGLEFIVSQDIFLNDMTMKYADVVLPASSFAEKDGTFTNTERRVNRVRAGVPCPGQARVDRDIVIDLARALGAKWPDYPDAESVWNEMADLAPAWYGIRYDRLEEQGMQWPAPELGHPGSPYPPRAEAGSGRRPREVLPGRVPAADRAARLGVPVHPQHRPDALSLQLGDDDDARVGHHRQAGDPFFEISAEDASNLGLAEGDLARISSRRGSLEARVAISDRVYPGLVWMALHFEGAKVNWLTHDVGDPLIGTPEYKISRCAGREAPDDRLARLRVCRQAPQGPLRAAVHVRRGVRVDAAAARRRRAGGCGGRLTDHRLQVAAATAASGRRRRARRCSARSPSIRPPSVDAPELTLVGAIAAAEAVEGATGLAAQIKWPNDVMLNRRKVCGVLGELRDGVVTLGIGLNVNQTREQLPSDAHTPAASLRTITGQTFDRAALLGSLLFRLERIYDQWRHGGLVDVFVEIGPRDFLRGRPVTVDGKSGIATGINCDGRLELDIGHGERVLVEAGEVVYER